MKCLVTGGAGFIGSHVADWLISGGHEVVIIDDLSGGFIENVPSGSTFIRCSILNHEGLAEIFDKHRFERIYHCAAYAAEGLSHFIKRFNHMNNLIGSVNLINEAVKRDVKCFVFTSSIAVYGRGQVPFKESDTPHPEDSYGIAKLAVEQELEATRRMFGLDYVIFRPHNVYGPRQNIGDRYRNVVGIFMNQCLRGEPMTIFGDGRQERAFTAIEDIAMHIAYAPAFPAALNKVFNIGSGQSTSVNELSVIVADAMGVPHRVVNLPARNEVEIAFSDDERFCSVFGVNHGVSLETGIDRMAEWVKKHGPKQPSEFWNIEIWKNLPPSWQLSNVNKAG